MLACCWPGAGFEISMPGPGFFWTRTVPVPTVAEQGFADFEATQWIGLLAPAATPRETIARLNAEIAALGSGLLVDLRSGRPHGRDRAVADAARSHHRTRRGA